MPKYVAQRAHNVYVSSTSHVFYNILFEWGGRERMGRYSPMFGDIFFGERGGVTKYPKYLKHQLAWLIYEAMMKDELRYFEVGRDSMRRYTNLRYFDLNTFANEFCNVTRHLEEVGYSGEMAIPHQTELEMANRVGGFAESPCPVINVKYKEPKRGICYQHDKTRFDFIDDDGSKEYWIAPHFIARIPSQLLTESTP